MQRLTLASEDFSFLGLSSLLFFFLSVSAIALLRTEEASKQRNANAGLLLGTESDDLWLES